MGQVQSVWETFFEYMGSYIWIVIFGLAVLYIYMQVEKRQRKIVLTTLLCFILFLYNDFVRNIVGKFIDIATYYRFFWLIPVTLICAYALLLFLTKKEYKLQYKILVVVAVFGILVWTNGTIWGMYSNQIPENKYQMSDDVWQLAELIKQNKKEDIPVVAMPQELELTYRTFDANVITAIGRTQYLYFSANGYESQEDGYYEQERILAVLVERNQQGDYEVMQDAMKARKVDYLVIHRWAGLENYMTELGCTLVGETNNYYLYQWK